MPSDASGESRSGLRSLRLVAVGVIALGLLMFVFIASHASGWGVCETSSGATHATCKAPTATDATVLVPLLLIVLLLIPDFSEIAIPGLISLKKQLAEQQKRQEALETRVEMTLSQVQSATAHATAPTFILTREGLQDMSLRVDAKEAALARGEPPVLAPPRPTLYEALSDEDARLATELLTRAERLNQARREVRDLEAKRRGATISASGGLSFSVSPTTQELMNWVEAFEEELQSVWAARNAVAHAQPVDRQTLEQAVELARKLDDGLTGILRRRQENAE